MPRTKSLSHYPSRYQEIVRECAIEGKRLEIELPEIKRGLSMRGHWYAFVGSLKSEAARIKRDQHGLLTVGEADLLELAAQVSSVMVQVEAAASGGCRVIWQNRENSWQAQALRAATITSGGSQPTSTELDSIAARLMKIKQGDEK